MEKAIHSAPKPQDPKNYRDVNWLSLERTPSRGLDGEVDNLPNTVEEIHREIIEQDRWRDFYNAGNE